MADAESLRSRLARKPIVVAPGVYDPFTALVAAQAGFNTLYVSGAAIAYTRLGRPDIGLVSMTEVADTLTLIRDRVEGHLIVDGDTGYGNALNVVRTVRNFERAGANAIQLEDQDFPKRCGHLDGKTLIAARGNVRQNPRCRRCKAVPRNARDRAHRRRRRRGLRRAIERAADVSRGGRRHAVRRGAEDARRSRAHGFRRSGTDAPLIANMVEGGKTPPLPAARAGGARLCAGDFSRRDRARARRARRASITARSRPHGTTEPFRDRMLDFNGINDADRHARDGRAREAL